MTTKLTLKQTLFAGLLAGIAAAVINGVLFFVFHAAGVIRDDIQPQPGQPMTIVPVIMASIVPLIIGSLVFFLFEKFTAKGFTIFATIALILAALSLFSPFTVIPNVTLGYSLVLCVMHIVAAVSLLYSTKHAGQNLALLVQDFQ